VRATTNPSFHRVLEEYRRLTGVGTLVNTSFNMHEEPIVCSPEDAVRAFLQGHLDYLAIGNYVVENPRLEPVVGQPPRRLP
jgi:carbamoyltransferase